MPQYPVIDKVKTGKQLKQLIKNKGYTIKDIQQYLSLSCIQTIYRWFDGINIPSVDNLYALSALLQVPVDRLLIGNREEDSRYTLMKLSLIHIWWGLSAMTLPITWHPPMIWQGQATLTVTMNSCRLSRWMKTARPV